MDPVPKIDFPLLPQLQPQPTKPSNVAVTTPSSPKIIVLGLTRTGSTSMFLSLQALGYKCSNQGIRTYQMLHSDIPAGNRKWYAALRAKYFGEGKVFGKEDWEGFLGGYDVRIIRAGADVKNTDILDTGRDRLPCWRLRRGANRSLPGRKNHPHFPPHPVLVSEHELQHHSCNTLPSDLSAAAP